MSGVLMSTGNEDRHPVIANLPTSLLNASPLPLVVWQVTAEACPILVWNPAAERLFGWSAEEALGEDWLNLLPATPQEADRLREIFQQVLSGQSVNTNLQIACHTKLGRTLWCGLSLAVMENPTLASSPTLVGFFSEAAEPHLLVEALRNSETTFESLVANLQDGITITRYGRVIYANEAMAALLGLANPKTMLTQDLAQYLAPESHRVWQGILPKGQAVTQSTHRLELAFCRPNGEKRLTESTLFTIPFAGRPHTIGIHHDITERVQAEMMQRLLTRALETAEVALMLADLQGNLVWANPAFTSLTGYPLDEVLGSQLLSLCPGGQAVVEQFYQVIATREPWEGDCMGLRKDGEAFFAHLSISPVEDSQGTLTHVAIIAWDVTAQRKEEKYREALLRLAEALRSPETLEAMLPPTVQVLSEAFEANGVAISLYDQDEDRLTVHLASGIWETLNGMSYAANYGISGHAFQSGAPYLQNNVLEDPHLMKEPQVRYPSRVIAVPLIAGENKIGVLLVGREAWIRPNDAAFVISAAEFAANALHRAQHYRELRKALHRLDSLRQIDMAILSQGVSAGAMETLARKTREHMRADAVAVWIYWPGDGLLRLVAAQGFAYPLAPGTPCRIGQGMPGYIAENGMPEILDNGISLYWLTQNASETESSETFSAYVGFPLQTNGALQGVLEIYWREPHRLSQEETQFLEVLCQQGAIALEKARILRELNLVNQQLEQAYDQTLEGLIYLLELRDDETEGHSRRVAEFTLRIAREMGFDEEQLTHLWRGALLHDIGKVGIPDAILLKKGPLDAEEWAVMKRHPLMAYEMLSKIPFLRPALDIPHCHHERWDGSGYPRGLKGKQIPLAARIFAVVDVWDALLSARPYRPPWEREQVRDYIREQAGKLFDPEVVEVFLRLEPSFQRS